jgi:hypothetical protein
VKTFTVALVAILVLVVAISVPAQESKEKIPVKVYTTGDRGIFEYRPLERDWRNGKTYPEFAVMHPLQNGGSAGNVAGFITSLTKVVFVDPALKGLSKSNLSLLHGKDVVVVARLRQEGEGEGTLMFCEELKIILLIDPR